MTMSTHEGFGTENGICISCLMDRSNCDAGSLGRLAGAMTARNWVSGNIVGFLGWTQAVQNYHKGGIIMKTH